MKDQYINTVEWVLAFRQRIMTQTTAHPSPGLSPLISIDASFMSFQSSATIYTDSISQLDCNTFVGKTLSLMMDTQDNHMTPNQITVMKRKDTNESSQAPQPGLKLQVNPKNNQSKTEGNLPPNTPQRSNREKMQRSPTSTIASQQTSSTTESLKHTIREMKKKMETYEEQISMLMEVVEKHIFHTEYTMNSSASLRHGENDNGLTTLVNIVSPSIPKPPPSMSSGVDTGDQ